MIVAPPVERNPGDFGQREHREALQAEAPALLAARWRVSTLCRICTYKSGMGRMPTPAPPVGLGLKATGSHGLLGASAGALRACLMTPSNNRPADAEGSLSRTPRNWHPVRADDAVG